MTKFWMACALAFALVGGVYAQETQPAPSKTEKTKKSSKKKSSKKKTEEPKQQ
jgi:hypothetical protein